MQYLGFFLMLSVAQGLFFSGVQLCNRSNLNLPKLFLSLVIIAFSIVIVENALWMLDKINHFVHLISVNEPLPLLFGPLIYFYFKSSLGNPKFNIKNLVHFLPFTLHVVYCSQFYFNSSGSKTDMLNGQLPYGSFFTIHISSWYFIISALISNLIYCGITWWQYYPKAKTLPGVKTWFLASQSIFSVYILNSLLFYFLSYNHLIHGCANYGIPLTMALFIYLFSWFGYVRPKVFEGFTFRQSISLIPEKNEVSAGDEIKAELWLKLQALMEQEKMYKQENLNLDFLAGQLNVSRHVLSSVINMKGINFFEYINHWRIEEAKKLLSATTRRELNIIEVAYEVGFNNKVSFNKFFKKSTGLTPTEYRKLALTKS